MPLHVEAFTEDDAPQIMSWILSEGFHNINDGIDPDENGHFHAVCPLNDSKSKMTVGKVVYTLFIDKEDKKIEVLDIDLVLNNENSTSLFFEEKLPKSSDSNEYYSAVTKETEQHLNIETVSRYVVNAEVEGTTQEVYLSAFPFELSIFENIEAFNSIWI